MELNREQVINAFKYCTDGGRCLDCQYDKGNYFTKEGCMACHMRDALALIKELTEENERFKGHLSQLKHRYDICKQNLTAARADTVRKMQERLKERLEKIGFPYDDVVVSERTIDQIAKEMLEGEP